jgi:peptide/nickel transport system substrate-binding protein
VQEAIANYLQQVGIRTKLIARARVALASLQRQEVQEPGVHGERRFGNAATRLEPSSVAGGAYVYGSYPEIDSLFKDQAAELDRKKREALLAPDPAAHAREDDVIPMWELAFINGQGPGCKKSGLGLIPGHAYSAPVRGREAEGEVTVRAGARR